LAAKVENRPVCWLIPGLFSAMRFFNLRRFNETIYLCALRPIKKQLMAGTVLMNANQPYFKRMTQLHCTMRGILFGMIFLFASTSTLLAQQRWSAGPRLGLNLSNFVGDVDNNNLLAGVSAGAFVMYSDINHFGISADVLYSQRGFMYKISEPQGPFKYRQRVNYLEIPILFRYFLNLSGNFRPNLFFGPNVGLKLGANRTNPDTDNSQIFRPADLGATVGISLNFRVKQAQRLHIDGRYTFGLTDITDPAKAPTPDGNVRNSTISVLLGYGFGIGKNYRR
jgi:hypothetical protein